MGLIPMLGAGYLANEYGPEIESLYNRWGPEAVQGVGQSGFQTRPTPGMEMQSYADAIRRSQERAFAGGEEQNALMGSLRGAAEGAGPSVAEIALRQATDENARAGAGLMASQRGLSPALGARMAGNMASRARQEGAGQGALLRAQEMLANRQLYAQALAQMRGQDLGMYGASGQLSGQQNQQRLQESLGLQGLEAGTAEGNAARRQQAALANAKARMELLGGMRESAQSGLGAIMKAAPLLLAHGGEVTREGVRQPDRDRYARALAGRLPVDDERRDTVPAMLSPGEVVVPRSVAQAPDAPGRTARYVAALRAQRRSAA